MIRQDRTPRRRPANLSLEADLVDEARRLGLNLSRAAEAARRWQEENRAAILSSNAYVERHGLPLAKYRMF